MQVTGLFHVAIKTNDLGATVKFYTDVLGMKLVDRPEFGFPRCWIGTETNANHPYLRRRPGAGGRQNTRWHRSDRPREPHHKRLE